MDRIVLGEDGACTGCGRVVWAGELVHCGSPRARACDPVCIGGLECVVLCDGCFRRLLEAPAPPSIS